MQTNAKLFTEWNETIKQVGAWSSAHFTGQWFQVDLYIIHEVHGLITQGSPDEGRKITLLKIALSNDTVAWDFIKKQGTNVDMVRCFILF